MNFVQLTQFKAVAECENLSLAAKQLFISQSTLTKAIQRLEAELGSQLFDRRGKKISLNATGQLVLNYVDTILETYGAMQEALRTIDAGRKALRLGTNLPNITRYITPLFRLEFQDVQLSEQYYDQSSLPSDLLTKHIQDVLLSPEPFAEASGICSELLFTDRIELCVPPDSPLAGKTGISPQALHKRDLVIASDIYGCYPLQQFFQFLQQEGIQPDYTFVQDIGALEYYLSISDGLTLSSSLTAKYFSFSDRTQIVIDAPMTNIPYYISYLQSRRIDMSPFIDWLKKVLNKGVLPA